ncbi:uncharacterized protein LOC116618253 [Nematostella vectensis]|uniref:uncharacterized protein LOC116618253 n=1 Tax=Nematostella vectensis TaxID=45351 RepID=UPI00207796E8|nr:uncharacterized protein LOC116618253 [Nematostella vectensis]
MLDFLKDHPVLTGLAVCAAGAAVFCYCTSSVESYGQGEETKEEVTVAVQDAVEDDSAVLLQGAEKSSQCQALLIYQARCWEHLLPNYKQLHPELHPRILIKIFTKPRMWMPIVLIPSAVKRTAIVDCKHSFLEGDILYLMSAITFAVLMCFIVNFVVRMHIEQKVKSLQVSVHHIQQRAIAATDRQDRKEDIQPALPANMSFIASSSGFVEVHLSAILGSLSTQSLESLASSASRQGRQVTLHPFITDSLATLTRPISVVLSPASQLPIALPSLVNMKNGKYTVERRSIKVHLVDYSANVPGHVSALPMSVSHLPHDDDQCVMTEKSESIEANIIRVTTLQLDLEEIKKDLPKILVKSVFGWVTEVCPDEETERDQARITQTELIKPSAPVKQVAVSSSPSVLRQLNFTEILGSLNTQNLESLASCASCQGRQAKLRPPLVDSLVSLMRPLRVELERMEPGTTSVKRQLLPAFVIKSDGKYLVLRRRVNVYLIDYCATEPKEVVVLLSSVCKLSHDSHQCLVGETLPEGNTEGDAILATDLAEIESEFSHLGENGHGENTKPEQRENCVENTSGEYVASTNELQNKYPFGNMESLNSIYQTTSMKAEQSDPTHQIGTDEGRLVYEDVSKKTTVEEEVSGLSLQCAPQITEVLEKEEYLFTGYLPNTTLASSSAKGPQLEIAGEEDGVSTNNLAADTGVLQLPNEGMDAELTSGHTHPMTTNGVDTSKGDQKLLHKCTHEQKKKAKRKNQRPKSSRRRSQKDQNDCPKKENEPELWVEGRKSIVHNVKAEATLEDEDGIHPKHNTSVTEPPDEGRDDISSRTRGVTSHKTSTASEAGTVIVNVEGEQKENNKLNTQTKQNKTKITSNKIDAVADRLSVQSAKLNVWESEKAKKKESFSVKKQVDLKRDEAASHQMMKKPCVKSRDDTHVTKHNDDVLIISRHKNTAPPPSGINASGWSINEATKSKRSKKVKHRSNNANDLPRKGHACEVMGRSNTSSNRRMGSYSTAAQKGYGTNDYEQEHAKSTNSIALRDEGMNSYSRLLVKANMHQGDGRLLIPGVQCCSIALCAILRATGKSPLMWTPEDIDDIIITGDRRHRETQQRMGLPKSAYLHIDEMEEEIKLRGRHFRVKKSDVLCGNVMNDGRDKNNPLPGIESSIESLNEYNMFIVRYLLYTIAIFKTSQTWLLFDSHNRDQNGFRHPDGKAVVLEFKTLRSVACYIRQFVSCNGLGHVTGPRPLDDRQLSYELAGVRVAVLS